MEPARGMSSERVGKEMDSGSTCSTIIEDYKPCVGGMRVSRASGAQKPEHFDAMSSCLEIICLSLSKS